MTKFDSAEAAAQYVKEADLSTPTFTLAISDSLTVSGKPDPMGLGMALVLDAILAKAKTSAEILTDDEVMAIVEKHRPKAS